MFKFNLSRLFSTGFFCLLISMTFVSVPVYAQTDPPPPPTTDPPPDDGSDDPPHPDDGTDDPPHPDDGTDDPMHPDNGTDDPCAGATSGDIPLGCGDPNAPPPPDPNDIGDLDGSAIDDLEPNTIKDFTGEHIDRLDPTAVGSLDSTQLGVLDPNAVDSFSSDHIGNLDPTAVSGFSRDHIDNLDPNAVAGFTSDQVGNLDPTAVGGFDSGQLGKLSDQAFGALDRDHVDNLDASALGGITGTQLANLDPTAAAGFDSTQLGMIPIDAIDDQSSDHVSQLDRDAVKGLSVEQFDSLDPTALQGFDRNNLGGLDDDVIRDLDPTDLANLNATEVQNLPDGDPPAFLTSLDRSNVSPDDVTDFLPSGWQIDSATGDLSAPPGADLAFPTLDQSGVDDGTTLPTLPDFSRDLSLGGGQGDDSVLMGLDSALDSANLGGFGFQQSPDGILTVASDGDPDTTVGAFIPDADNMTQAADGFTPGIAVDDRGAYVLTTDDGYQTPLLPTARDPDDIVGAILGSEVTVGGQGETRIDLPESDGGGPVVGAFDPVVEITSDAAGLYRTGSGADEEIRVVYEDGTSQTMRPAINNPDEFDQAARAVPGVESVEINTDGTIDVRFDGVDLVLRPLFDVTDGTAAGSADPTLTVEDGRFFFDNSNGDRQEFVAI
ncbi:MAG TPA: hypothetical protein DCM64_06990 [Gammaproteobacteria bacterium]|jgi:hypothetical protein|nr:hypothetical protein [Gammaproteobacteria bacterium]MDP6732334.1 hypothetical protein [Gammaproteobacteria bacterium]HAJ76185.1 hypothetical protein [Gammaproteobacteria bacterium]|tara:strand:- start:396 stop:2381 length:1986 start_codon:yes stop_codon:yes gene_type:complete